ncbi:MAG: hypothetical protein IKN94_05945 [Salinivirgaceae bacterium]|nr:hypothetical protein [Salinivirgaceae bacterium]
MSRFLTVVNLLAVQKPVILFGASDALLLLLQQAAMPLHLYARHPQTVELQFKNIIKL